MSKIYEALESAKRQLSRFASPVVSSPPLQSDMEEEIMQLYQTITTVKKDGEAAVIQFIGSIPGEGVSTIVRETAKVLSGRLCMQVLLIDADYGNPSQYNAFGLTAEGDLHRVVGCNQPVEVACRQVAGSSLHLCQVSDDASFITTLCGSSDLDHLWEEMRNAYDVILIDSPPASVATAGFDFCRKADGVVLVVEAEKTRWPVAQNVKEKILRNDGKILGILFNKRRFYIPQWVYKRL